MHSLGDRRLLAGVANYGHRPSDLAKRRHTQRFTVGEVLC